MLSCVSSILAYIDPGTGATFIGSLGPLIVGFFAAVGAFGVRYFWHPIKQLFSRSSKSDEKQE